MDRHQSGVIRARNVSTYLPFGGAYTYMHSITQITSFQETEGKHRIALLYDGETTTAT